MASYHEYQRPIYVNCTNCGRIREEQVIYIDIEEDIQGRDVLTFECPFCHTTQRSLRFG